MGRREHACVCLGRPTKAPSREDLLQEAVEPPRPEKGKRENDDRRDDVLDERVNQRHRRRRPGRPLPSRE